MDATDERSGRETFFFNVGALETDARSHNAKDYICFRIIIVSPMTVKDLCELLAPEENGETTVCVRCSWHGEAPAHDRFDIAGVVMTFESDTAEGLVLLECRQDG